MKAQEYLQKHGIEFLGFLKTRVPVYHLSNIFFRDAHYAVIDFLAARGMRVKYGPAEPLARRVLEQLEKERVLVRLDHQTWMVNHSDYRTPVRKAAPAAAPAKPAAPAPPVQRAAGAPARPAAAGTATGTPANAAAGTSAGTASGTPAAPSGM